MDTIGGYRLVRKLGAGERADVFLGHTGGSGAGSAARTAAVKVYRQSTPLAGIDAEIEALARASSRHLLRLDDLSTAPDGLPVLILGRLGSISLAGLLARRGTLGWGEAVTILAPLALAITELHRVGIAHRRVRPGTVLFDDAGAPVLSSFGRATLIGAMPERQEQSSLTPAALGGCADAVQDLVDLVALASGVLELTPDSRRRAGVLEWLRRVHPEEAPDRFGSELGDILFDFAEPTPVDLTGAHPVAASTPDVSRAARREARHALEPGRAGGARVAAELETPRMPTWIAALHLPDWLDGLRRRADRSALNAVAVGVRRLLAPVRRPVWFAAGASAVLLVAALLLVPSPAAPAPSTPSAPVGETDLRGDQAASDRAIAADDPVAAASALLRLREECLSTESVLCLDGVDQAGSAAWEADGYTVRQLQDGSPLPRPGPIDGAVVTLVERMGGSALLTLTMPEAPPDSNPASLLLVKGEAGWRIRDLIVG